MVEVPPAPINYGPESNGSESFWGEGQGSSSSSIVEELSESARVKLEEAIKVEEGIREEAEARARVLEEERARAEWIERAEREEQERLEEENRQRRIFLEEVYAEDREIDWNVSPSYPARGQILLEHSPPRDDLIPTLENLDNQINAVLRRVRLLNTLLRRNPHRREGAGPRRINPNNPIQVSSDSESDLAPEVVQISSDSEEEQ